MNSPSDLNRSIRLIKAIFAILLGLLFASMGIFQISEPEYTGKTGILVLLQTGLTIVSLVLLYHLIKTLKTASRNTIDTEKALQTSEKKYKSMVENIQIGFARSTPGIKGQYIEVNSFFAKMLGYSREELIQMPVSELYEDASKRKSFSDKISRNELVKDEEIRFCKKDGSIITVAVTGQAIRDDDGHIIFFDLILDDVTKKKLNHEESIKNEKLSSIGILAGGIAHDFNNILTGLYGNIALAKLELDPASEASQLIQDAEQSMSKATDLTQQLLIFAKGGDPIKETIPLEQTIQDAAKFNLSGSNIRLETHFDDDLWQVHADKTQLTQVISNLVINARHAMPEGGILTIAGKNIELNQNEIASLPEGKYLKILVQDQGIGIPPDCMAKIFDPYFTTKHAGSGMGLATSFSIIKKHNGWLTAESETDRGACFTLYLPAQTTLEVQSRLKGEIVGAGLQSARILIMDDDLQICVIAHKMIKLFGYDSFAVHDGETAVRKYESAIKEGKPFDLILMDLTIPGGMGGKEAIIKILDIEPDAKAIVVSGYSNDPVLANYRDYGFSGMLVKPFKMEQLKEAIDTALK